MKEFDLNNFCKESGISNGKLEPYDYEKYKAINPKLTETLYRRMREGGALWKITLGRKHTDKYVNETLEGSWLLQMKANYIKL